ncbi:hypothetical protein K504DRAFT_227860 [Pleomassaria siparia CBS 279.74]|uniref:Uncharacterized protein n=1 Tax=Pleomassaria siparia CBS 279.74 TaxID=1314801 RepID=A0A6G1KGW5_9PLEO|nr:hypothetical protein K504DRAFT_227860 [Pleomassaria siparia CBS 279.74]
MANSAPKSRLGGWRLEVGGWKVGDCPRRSTLHAGRWSLVARRSTANTGRFSNSSSGRYPQVAGRVHNLVPVLSRLRPCIDKYSRQLRCPWPLPCCHPIHVCRICIAHQDQPSQQRGMHCQAVRARQRETAFCPHGTQHSGWAVNPHPSASHPMSSQSPSQQEQQPLEGQSSHARPPPSVSPPPVPPGPE